MPLTIRPTGLGAGIYQGRPDYSHLGGANSESTARRELELRA